MVALTEKLNLMALGP